MQQLDEAYKKILQFGLIGIREAAALGDLARCKAEAEHLHNLPSLLGETDIQRHLFYFSVEKSDYLEWVLSTKRKELMEFVSVMYVPYWTEIEAFLVKKTDLPG